MRRFKIAGAWGRPGGGAIGNPAPPRFPLMAVKTCRFLTSGTVFPVSVAGAVCRKSGPIQHFGEIFRPLCLAFPPHLMMSDRSPAGEVPVLQVDSLRFGVAFALILAIVQRVIGLLRSILFCRILPEEQLGQWSLTWSYLMLLAPLAVLGLPGSFSRYVETYRRRGQLRTFLVRVTLVSLLATGLFSFLLFALAGPLAEWLYRDANQVPLVHVLAATLFVVVAFNFATSLMESLRQVRLVTVMRMINGVGFALLSLGLLLVWPGSIEAITLGFVLSCLIALVPAIVYLSRNRSIIGTGCQPLAGSAMWARVAPFALWLWTINVVSNLYETADRTMLLHLAPVSAAEAQILVGQYHSGRVLPLVLVGLAAMLSGILLPYMTAHWERGDRGRVIRQMRWTLKLTALGFTAAGIAVLAFAPLLFSGVFAGKYNGGLAVLPLTLVYCIWYGLMTVGQDYLWCREQGKWGCLVLGLGLGVNLMANVLLIPRFGLTGAVWATTVSTLTALIALLLVNACFGCRPDRGIWLTAALPLVLVLPVTQATVILVVVAWAGIHYGWLFDEREKQELVRTVEWFGQLTRSVRPGGRFRAGAQ